jgi:hypothetical protein
MEQYFLHQILSGGYRRSFTTPNISYTRPLAVIKTTYMKKLLLSILISLLFYFSKAQENRYSTWGFGFGVLYDKLNIETLNLDTLIGVEHKSKPGWAVYVSYIQPIKKYFLIRANIGFNFTNNDLNYYFSDTSMHLNNLYGAICLPISLVIKPFNNKDYEFVLKPEIDYILMDGYNSINRINSSIGIGIGKELKFKPINVSIDLFYNWGLTNYYKSTTNFQKERVYGVKSIKQNLIELNICLYK